MEKKVYPQSWTDVVGKFAEAIGKGIDEVTEKLTPIVGEPSDEALAYLASQTAVPDADIKDALKDLGVPSGKMNTHIEKLRGEKPVVVSEEKSPGKFALNILPTPPDEESFIAMLKVDGVLKIGKPEVISAFKASIANQVGLYGFLQSLLEQMRNFARSQNEPCGAAYYDVQRTMNERKYAEVLSVINVSAAVVTEASKKELLAAIDEYIWSALRSFQNQLAAWQTTWMQTATNPAFIMMAITSGQSGNNMLSAGMQAPDTAPIRAAGEEVINSINKVFSVTGIPVSRAMAYDASRIIKVINDPKILTQSGFASKDQMLKSLGVSVGAELVRLEQGITQYALAIMSLPEVKAEEEVLYLTTLHNLGSTIPWDKLGNKKGVASRSLTD
jgi:hypothetical protein